MCILYSWLWPLSFRLTDIHGAPWIFIFFPESTWWKGIILEKIHSLLKHFFHFQKLDIFSPKNLTYLENKFLNLILCDFLCKRGEFVSCQKMVSKASKLLGVPVLLRDMLLYFNNIYYIWKHKKSEEGDLLLRLVILMY